MVPPSTGHHLWPHQINFLLGQLHVVVTGAWLVSRAHKNSKHWRLVIARWMARATADLSRASDLRNIHSYGQGSVPTCLDNWPLYLSGLQSVLKGCCSRVVGVVSTGSVVGVVSTGSSPARQKQYCMYQVIIIKSCPTAYTTNWQYLQYHPPAIV